MAQRFETLEELNDYVDFLTMKGKPIPEWVIDEETRLKRESTINSEEYIFSTMAAHNKFMTPEKEKVVREMTDQLLIDGEKATQPCLLLGKVQCGKTDTFESIIGLCFDKGIDIAIVMTKGTNMLTNQTIKRLKYDFRYFDDNGTYWQKAIVRIYDALDLYKLTGNGLREAELKESTKRFIIVCKKEITNLKYLNDMFANNELMRMKKVLICDDEADFASHAYLKGKGKEGMQLLDIANEIEQLRKQPSYCRYMQITATPYSLYLHPDGTVQLREGKEAMAWLPRYTGVVPIHEHYIGGRQYYELSQEGETDSAGIFHPANMYGCLYENVTDECLKVLKYEHNNFYLESGAHSGILDPLNYAVVIYLFGTAIRVIQERKKQANGIKYKSSCLIHCEVNKAKHKAQEAYITKIIEDVKYAILDRDNADLHIQSLESDAYNDLKLSNQLGNRDGEIDVAFPTQEEVVEEVKRILEKHDHIIKVVNSEEHVASMLNEKGQLRLEQTLNFFIGGSILDRGVTIDNMLCFFYGRDPKKFQMDTVLQHARMYGARSKEDMACTRFFTTPEIFDILSKINLFDSNLYHYLEKHPDAVQSNDFTSMVIGYDKRISPSAQNKYLPAETLVLKPGLRRYPVGMQTVEPEVNEPITKKIEDIVNRSKKQNKPNEDGFFLMDYNDVVKVLQLIRESYVFASEYNNLEQEWDINDMVTPLEHLTFDSDGMILVIVRGNRNLSRERENIYDKRGRFIDAPEAGNEIITDRANAQDRPVLVLLKQNGAKELGWRGTPFFWPVLTMPEHMEPGIFTINGNKKFRKGKKQIQLDCINHFPKEEVLSLTIGKDLFFDILLGRRKINKRDIKPSTVNAFLKRDINGDLILAENVDQTKNYNLSSVNDNVFPFEVKKYKYVHYRTSMDFSGSQAIVSLDAVKPYELKCEPFEQQDVVYSEDNIGSDMSDWSYGNWYYCLHLDKVLEQKLSVEDQEALNNYQAELETQSNQEQNESNA
jgi:hypothetical protein